MSTHLEMARAPEVSAYVIVADGVAMHIDEDEAKRSTESSLERLPGSEKLVVDLKVVDTVKMALSPSDAATFVAALRRLRDS